MGDVVAVEQQNDGVQLRRRLCQCTWMCKSCALGCAIHSDGNVCRPLIALFASSLISIITVACSRCTHAEDSISPRASWRCTDASYQKHTACRLWTRTQVHPPQDASPIYSAAIHSRSFADMPQYKLASIPVRLPQLPVHSACTCLMSAPYLGRLHNGLSRHASTLGCKVDAFSRALGDVPSSISDERHTALAAPACAIGFHH